MGHKLSPESVIPGKAAGDLVPGKFSARSPMETRPHIEIPAAGLAAARTTADQPEELRGIIEAMEAKDDPEEWVALNAGFHATIAAASGNGVFERVVSDIREAMANQSGTSNLLTGHQHPSHAEHRAILSGIERRERAAAGKAPTRILGEETA